MTIRKAAAPKPPDAPGDIVARWFEGAPITRSQRKALGQLLVSPDFGENELHALLDDAFARAGAGLSPVAKSVLAVTHDVVHAVVGAAKSRGTARGVAEAAFSPGEQCRVRLIELLDSCVKTADICVYTLTDDELTRALLRAHHRGVKLRLLTEADTTTEPGNDIDALAAKGIQVRRELGDGLMHHKFAILDDRTLATGSYNWTSTAASRNFDNLIVTDESRLVRPFAERFEEMWGGVGAGLEG